MVSQQILLEDKRYKELNSKSGVQKLTEVKRYEKSSTADLRWQK